MIGPSSWWDTFEESVEYGEKGSRVLDYTLLLLLTRLPNHPPWMDQALKAIRSSRDIIELGTCAKELGLAYRGLSEIDDSDKSRLHSKLHPFRRVGDALICLSAIFTPLAIAHAWIGLPLGRYSKLVEETGKWAICLGHGVCLFGEKGLSRIDMGSEALFFGMEAGFLDKCPLPLQTLIAVGSGTWGLWRIPQQH